jgi:hypothetical protein
MKKRNITLIITLIILIILAYFVMEKPGERTVDSREKLIEIDSAKIDKIWVNTQYGEVELKLNNGEWTITKPISYKPNLFKINAALSQSADMQIINEATSKPGRHSVYGVDSAAVQVKLYQGAKQKAHLLIGNMGSQPMETFVRKFDDDNVYLVKGALTYIFNSPLKDWRDRTIIDLADEQVNEVKITYEKESYSLVLSDSVWRIGNSPANPEIVNRFLNSLKYLETDFFEDEAPEQLPPVSLSIEINGINLYIHKIDEDRFYAKTSNSQQLFIILLSKARAISKTKAELIEN